MRHGWVYICMCVCVCMLWFTIVLLGQIWSMKSVILLFILIAWSWKCREVKWELEIGFILWIMFWINKNWIDFFGFYWMRIIAKHTFLIFLIYCQTHIFIFLIYWQALWAQFRAQSVSYSWSIAKHTFFHLSWPCCISPIGFIYFILLILLFS